MKCVILAAGYATRLYPLTENFPKPLLKVQGKAILDWLLEDLETGGKVDGYVVVSNHKFADIFQQWKNERPQWDITILDDGTTTNDNRIGAVRDTRLAIEQLHLDEELLVIAGDNLLDFSLNTLIDYGRAKGTSCVFRYYEPEVTRLQKSGVMCIDAEGQILKMEEKPTVPQSHWCCPPFYYFVRSDVARVEEGLSAGCGADAPGSYLAWLSSVSPVHAMEMPGRRYDIGNLQSYQAVQENYKGIHA